MEIELQVCALRNHKVLFYRRRAACMSNHFEHRYYLSLLHGRPRRALIPLKTTTGPLTARTNCICTLHSVHCFNFKHGLLHRPTHRIAHFKLVVLSLHRPTRDYCTALTHPIVRNSTRYRRNRQNVNHRNYIIIQR